MAREGLRAGQVAFYWGKKTTAEINTLISSGDLEDGDLVFNTDTNSQLIYANSMWKANSGSGGGGTGVELLAVSNAIEKMGGSISLPNANNVRNSFTNSSKLLCYLRKNYTISDGITIVLDHGLDSELETQNDMETVGDFTAGTNTPTVAANTTDFLEGTQSVKISKTVNGSIDMYDTVTLSLSDRHFRVSAYPSTLTDVSYIYVVFYTSSGNQRRFNFAATDLVATSWNHLTCDLDATVDGTIIADTGTFEISNITRIYYGITTTSSISIECSFDLSRAISSQPLLVPGYSLSISIQDETNQDTFSLMSEDRTNNVTKGSFTASRSLNYNFGISDGGSGATYLSSNTGTVSNNQFTHNSAAVGQNAKTAKQHEAIYLSTTLDTGTLESFIRFNEESFEVEGFPTTSTISLKQINNSSLEQGRFLNDDYILLYKKLRVGYKDQSIEGTGSINFKRLQLNADALSGSGVLLLSHDGDNSIGVDTTGYYVVPESSYLEYIAGGKTTTSIVKPSPNELLILGAAEELFSDDFSRGTGVLGGGWSTYGTLPTVYLNQWNHNGSTVYGTSLTGVSKHTLDFSKLLNQTSNLKISATFKQSRANWAGIWYVGLGCNVAPNPSANSWPNKNTGFYVEMSNAANTLTVGDVDGVVISSSTSLFQNTNTNAVEVLLKYRTVEVRIWNVVTQTRADATIFMATKGSNWNVDNTNNVFLGAGTNCLSGGSANRMNYDDFEVASAIKGYTLKYKIENLTELDKVETITTIKRNDETNQNPLALETGTVIY